MRREMRDVIVLQISTGVPWAHGRLEPIGKILQETMKSTTVTSRMLGTPPAPSAGAGGDHFVRTGSSSSGGTGGTGGQKRQESQERQRAIPRL
jgi:hypothetical protein